ncbi:GGDEF domain-containing protein [Deinococcus hopiensis]|uniref:Diguanylate cyclase (GGDEF) domain-containing protein n=1 Tax=Deinococcus hopiensis KR-140 TaxID=695939 RepID=A0A1W1VAD6_9DEIO|nr:GGDEF domain-containing protein [Deinococcus hopiensis]SMB90318.1 diguanylate cyclase (GGDEF) domain-containing protein [Deinococcus hopiensis KR-140]
MSSARPEPVPAPPGAPLPLREALESARTHAARAAAYLALARHYRERSLPLALPLAQAALDWALLDAEPGITVEALVTLGYVQVGQGQQEQAFGHLALALDLAHEHGLRHLESQVRNTRAVARLIAGDLPGARRDLMDSLRLAQEAGHPQDLLTAHINLSHLNNLAGQYGDALHQLNLLEEQLNGQEEGELQYMRLYLFENRAHIYLNQAREARARGRGDAEREARARSEGYLQAIRDAMRGHPDRLIALTTATHAARLALLAGDVDAAWRHAQAALGHHLELGQQTYLDAHLVVAEVCEAREEPERAHLHYRAALDAARQQGRHRDVQDILQKVARLHEAQGHLEAALGTYREAVNTVQGALTLLAQIEQRNSDLMRELRQARAEAHSWQESVRLAETQARQDALTGLLNRRGLHDALLRLEREDGPLLLALFDIDHFKHVNDRHSHAVGDAALQAVAKCLCDHLPDGAFLTRYGGEEFLLVVPAVPHQPGELVEQMRAAVEGSGWSDLPPGLSITISAGYVVASHRHGDHVRGALAQADDHLYQAKRAGRNRVHPPVGGV